MAIKVSMIPGKNGQYCVSSVKIRVRMLTPAKPAPTLSRITASLIVLSDIDKTRLLSIKTAPIKRPRSRLAKVSKIVDRRTAPVTAITTINPSQETNSNIAVLAYTQAAVVW